MYRRFAFEGPIHESLECVPLAVRRKLDLARYKISLAGWQALTRAERLSLCHLPVDTAEDLATYREVFSDFAARAGVALGDLPDPDAPGTWNASRPPALLAERLSALGVVLPEDAWRRLPEEERYALLKLADPKREPAKLRTLAVELGLLLLPGS